MADFSRTRRVGEQMQRELAQLIQQEVRDPRVGWVTVSAVQVSRDLSHAKVYVTTLGEGETIKEALAGLHSAEGFLRHELGRRMKLRLIPELRFVYDESIERGARMERLIDSAVGRTQDQSRKDEE